MIPYSYNMVDMGGIDLAEANGTVVEGLYNRLALARNACGDLILYNWKFVGIEIVPSPCSTLDEGTSILINGAIQVTEEDVVTVPGINPDPVIEPLVITENGVYEVPEDVDGFNPVTAHVSPLPVGYTQKNYLEASGTQYLDTGVRAQGDCYAEVEFEFSSSVSGWHSIISGENANVTKSFKFAINGMTGGTVQNDSNWYDFSKSFQLNQKYRACVGNGLVIDGEFFQKFSKTTFTSDNNIALFADIAGSAEAYGHFTGRIYSCKMWLNGLLNRDFIPCIRDSDDTAGMYDIVNDVFYVNAGTGEFIYG